MAIYGPFTPTGREKCGVIVCYLRTVNRPRHEADAALIAAAPALLNACKAIIAAAPADYEQRLDEAWPLVVAAIAKAEGR